MADYLGGELIATSAGSFCLIKRTYPQTYYHGDIALNSIDPERCFSQSAFAVRNEPDQVSASSLLFIDTETTGLGGAGTVAFLVGIGSLGSDGFTIKQYIIPDFSDEAGMLEALLEDFTDNAVLVSYNGRAFDLPILQDRMIINRVAREVPYWQHIDLLHPTRRLFRRRLRDCSLTNIEQELFHFFREDDLPGYLVPSVYFDWLTEERLDTIDKVLEHNRLDIISLCFLTAHLAEAFESNGESLNYIDDLHSLSRIHNRRKNLKQVLLLNKQVESITTPPPAEDIILFHAQAYKRTGDYKQAIPLWKQLVSSKSREGCLACIELAKYYEHHVCNYPLAHKYASSAINSERLTPRQKAMIYKRIARLDRKLSR